LLANDSELNSTRRNGCFDLYLSDNDSYNHTILFNSNELDMIFTTFQNPNHMKSSDPRIVSEAKLWMERSKQMAKPLTKGKVRAVHSYFEHQRKEIEEAKALAEHLISVRILRL